MGVKWTKQQQQVIDLRDRNILVSAAAGSGKTAVLVERIITMLTDEEHPVNVDELLIVTFTEAAAGEMKERIRGAIEKALEENPENEHLKRQATLIHNAQITTIHSFCLSVIRDHFHVIDIDPGFRTAEEGELKLLRHDVLDELLEEKYAQKEERFLRFSNAYGGRRNDKKLEEMFGSHPTGSQTGSGAKGADREVRSRKQPKKEKKAPAPQQNWDEREYQPIRKSREMRSGCLGGLMYFVFVVSVSVILACLGWMAASRATKSLTLTMVLVTPCVVRVWVMRLNEPP